MSTIGGISCTDCGKVKLTDKDITVRVCTDNNQRSYTFCCPECHMRVAKPATWHDMELLIAGGCRLKRWTLPKELEEHKLGEPINHNDLLDFHDEMLEGEDFIDELRSYMDEARVAVRAIREERAPHLKRESWNPGEINNA